jgi:methylated-DNA-[protein]-cysteine S-methyltransferase
MTTRLSVRTTVATPVGTLTLVASSTGLQAVLLPGDPPARLSFPDTQEVEAAGDSVLAVAASQLIEYFEGRRRAFDVPLDPGGTPFQRRAWEVLSEIPYGETITYAEQARRLGSPSAVRAVGGANGRNPIAIIVPCHRVVGANGHLTGYAGGLAIKAWLLDHERGLVTAGVG